MELNPIIKQALLDIDFIERYQRLSDEYSAEKVPSKERLVYVDGDEVFEMLSKLGYESSFDSREKFFKIKEEHLGKYRFGFHISLRDGNAELIWVVKEGDNVLLGLPWGIYSRLMIDPDYRIKRPVYGTYDDLEHILEVAFEMYKDFKNAIGRLTDTRIV